MNKDNVDKPSQLVGIAKEISYLIRDDKSVMDCLVRDDWEIFRQVAVKILEELLTGPLVALGRDHESIGLRPFDRAEFGNLEFDDFDAIEVFVFSREKNLVLYVSMNWLGYPRGYELYLHKGIIDADMEAVLENCIGFSNFDQEYGWF